MFGIRLCGYKICWHKPIKVYAIIRRSAILASAILLVAGPALPAAAAERAAATTARVSANNSSSPVDAVRLSALSLESGEATVGINPPASKRLQRTAGNVPLPAMALAIALGLRTVHGPLERAEKVP
jgi:hypothetical protein